MAKYKETGFVFWRKKMLIVFYNSMWNILPTDFAKTGGSIQEIFGEEINF